jgi:hypothetical protein
MGSAIIRVSIVAATEVRPPRPQKSATVGKRNRDGDPVMLVQLVPTLARRMPAPLIDFSLFAVWRIASPALALEPARYAADP